VLSLLVVALVAREVSAAHAHAVTSDVTWVGAPVAMVPLAVDPQVACPTESLGDCDLGERFLVANEVVYQRTIVLTLSLFGGLYGS
jgi:hypothetical protein